MGLRIIQFVRHLLSSYWFIPSLMCLASIGLAVGMVVLDVELGSDWFVKSLPIFSTQPEGARALLSTVAASMITVAGVTFSLTILAVSHASSQFGPHVLTNFMKNRSNQITLGTFIATFLYCLLVLGVVRGAGSSERSFLFVPHASLLVALLLTILSVLVLIHFFHHMPESMRLPNVLEDLGRDFVKGMERTFPRGVGEDAPDDKKVPTLDPALAYSSRPMLVRSEKNAYLEAIDGDSLITLADKSEAFVELMTKPGDFKSIDAPLFKIWVEGASLKQEKLEQFKDCFIWGNKKTPDQNVMFLANQLVQVALRALSPGINDPLTAVNCIDRLESGLSELMKQPESFFIRYDSRGKARLKASGVDFVDALESISSMMRPHAASERTAALHLMRSYVNLSEKCERDSYKTAISSQARLLTQHCEKLKMFEQDLKEIKALQAKHLSAKPVAKGE